MAPAHNKGLDLFTLDVTSSLALECKTVTDSILKPSYQSASNNFHPSITHSISLSFLFQKQYCTTLLPFWKLSNYLFTYLTGIHFLHPWAYSSQRNSHFYTVGAIWNKKSFSQQSHSIIFIYSSYKPLHNNYVATQSFIIKSS